MKDKEEDSPLLDIFILILQGYSKQKFLVQRIKQRILTHVLFFINKLQGITPIKIKTLQFHCHKKVNVK